MEEVSEEVFMKKVVAKELYELYQECHSEVFPGLESKDFYKLNEHRMVWHEMSYFLNNESFSKTILDVYLAHHLYEFYTSNVSFVTYYVMMSWDDLTAQQREPWLLFANKVKEKYL